MRRPGQSEVIPVNPPHNISIQAHSAAGETSNVEVKQPKAARNLGLNLSKLMIDDQRPVTVFNTDRQVKPEVRFFNTDSN